MSKPYDVYLVDGINENSSIERARKILAGFPHGADKAIGSAIKRAAQSGEAMAAKGVREHYLVNAGTFKEYTKSKRHIVASAGQTNVDIEFRGYHIPLAKFETRVNRSGRVSVRVKRSSARTVLNSVFEGRMYGGHRGLYERVTDKRLPIEEKLGPSTPQMMSNDEDLEQEVGDKIRETFEKRLEHEISAILNGWRV